LRLAGASHSDARTRTGLPACRGIHPPSSEPGFHAAACVTEAVECGVIRLGFVRTGRGNNVMLTTAFLSLSWRPGRLPRQREEGRSGGPPRRILRVARALVARDHPPARPGLSGHKGPGYS